MKGLIDMSPRMRRKSEASSGPRRQRAQGLKVRRRAVRRWWRAQGAVVTIGMGIGIFGCLGDFQATVRSLETRVVVRAAEAPWEEA